MAPRPSGSRLVPGWISGGLLLLLLLGSTHSRALAYYLPGVAPVDYGVGDTVALDVNALTSSDSLLPFDYYDERFHFCRPPGDEPVAKRESLGAILFGDRLYSSPFKIAMMKNSSCTALCTVKVPAADVDFLRERIQDEYSMNWIVDGLPAAQYAMDRQTKEFFYTIGFDLGQVGSAIKPDSENVYLNNHYDIEVHYHARANSKYRVVGVVVSPYSVKSSFVTDKCQSYAYDDPQLELHEGKEASITYSYNVIWKEDPISWGTRWDMYLHVMDPQIHWFSLINSIVIVLMLTGMTSMILLRALHKDIAKYNAVGGDDVADDFGWKLVHGDVFRPPRHRMILSILVGNGFQFFFMTGTSLFLALLGFMSPSARGTLSTVTVMLYFLLSSVSGYVSARVYKMQQGEDWRTNVIFSAILVPGVIFGILLLLNFVLVAFHSSAAVPFSTLVSLIALWFLVSIPLCGVGAYLGFKAPVHPNPVKTNQIPRQIPDKPFFLNDFVSAAIGGILPFGAIFIELYFIMNSMWFHQIYYVFGFLTLVFVVLVVTCAQVSILLTYFHLCAEDYLWPWKSFFSSASTGAYVFLYSIVFYARKLSIHNTASTLLYFGWSMVLCILFGILTGTIGYVASWWFVRKIFASIKVD